MEGSGYTVPEPAPHDITTMSTTQSIPMTLNTMVVSMQENRDIPILLPGIMVLSWQEVPAVHEKSL